MATVRLLCWKTRVEDFVELNEIEPFGMGNRSNRLHFNFNMNLHLI